MANSLFSEGEISLRRADYPPIAKRLVPQMADKPKLLAGLEEQGYVMVNAVDDLYVGYDGNQSGYVDAATNDFDPAISQVIEFRSEDYGDACIDLSRSFVSATLQCEYLAGVQTPPVAWTGASRDYPMSLRNGAGQLLFSRCETEINNTRVEDDADATEDGPALSGWVQVLTQEKATYARGGPARVWAVPGPQAGAVPGPADTPMQEGYYFAGTAPAAGAPTSTTGTPRCISASVGHPAANEEAWSLCDDWNIVGGTDAVPLRQSTFGENTQYPFGQSRGSGAAALSSSFDAAGNSRTTLRFRPASSLWRQPVCLPAGCRVNLRLYKSQIQRWLQSQYYDDVAGGGQAGVDGHIWATRAYWERVSLWLWIVRPREMILRDIRHSLATEKFLIPLTARRIFAAQPDAGQTGFVASGLFPGVQPARVWVWLTRAHQQNGMSAQDLARFSPYAMSPYGCHEGVVVNGGPAANTFPSLGTNDKIPIIDYAAITTPDGRQYPQNGYNNPLVIEEVERRYATYLAACDDAQTPVLSLRAYSANYPILCFDINQQTAGMASSDADNVLGVPLPYNNEGLTLRLQFHTAVNNTAEAGDSLPGLWVVAVAESVGGLLFYGGPHGLHDGAVRVKKIGY